MTSIGQPADESCEPIPAELRRRDMSAYRDRYSSHRAVGSMPRPRVALCPNCHRRADKGEIDRKALRLYKFNLRFLHDKYSQVEMDVLFGLAKLPDGEFERWPAFNRILLRRIEESGFITVREMMGGMITGGIRVAPDAI